jgi:hypothetical protein
MKAVDSDLALSLDVRVCCWLRGLRWIPLRTTRFNNICLCDLEQLPRALSLGTCSVSPFSHYESTIDRNKNIAECSEYGDGEGVTKDEKMNKD